MSGDLVEDALDVLTLQEQNVLVLRYSRTLQEMGRELNMTPERVHQTEAKALERIDQIEATALRRLRHPSLRKRFKGSLGQ